jgi:hypothetical protein
MFRRDKDHILAGLNYFREILHCRALGLPDLSKDTYSQADNLHFALSNNKTRANMVESRTSSSLPTDSLVAGKRRFERK